MKIYKIGFLVCLFTASTYLYAAQYEYTGDCKFDGRMSVFEHCLEKELAKYDRELNTLYRRHEKETHNKRLKKAEILWVKFKEADCEHMAYEVNGGTEFSSIETSCLINKTKARIADLKRPFYYKGWFE